MKGQQKSQDKALKENVLKRKRLFSPLRTAGNRLGIYIEHWKMKDESPWDSYWKISSSNTKIFTAGSGSQEELQMIHSPTRPHHHRPRDLPFQGLIQRGLRADSYFSRANHRIYPLSRRTGTSRRAETRRPDGYGVTAHILTIIAP